MPPSLQAVTSQDERSLLLNQALRCFVRSLLQGVQLELLLDDGSAVTVEVSFNFEITQLVLRVNELQRCIALDDVERVCGPDEVDHVHTSNHGWLDERCTTLVVKSQQFLTFTFDTARMREYFEACFKALVATRSAQVKKQVAEVGEPGPAEIRV